MTKRSNDKPYIKPGLGFGATGVPPLVLESTGDKLPDPAAEAEARDLVEHPHDPYTTAPVVDLTRPLHDALTYEHAGHGSALVLESTGEGELEELDRIESYTLHAHLKPGTTVIKLAESLDSEGRRRLMVRHAPPGGQSSFDKPLIDVLVPSDGIPPELTIYNIRHTSDEKET